MADGLSVLDWREFASPAAIAEWDALALMASEPNSFLESWSLLPALANLDRESRVQLMIYRENGRLAGLMPISRPARYYRYPLPHWQNWLHHNAFCGVPLVANGAEHRFWAALLASFDSKAAKALFLHLSHLPEGGTLAKTLESLAREQRRPFAVVHREERAMLQSGQAPEDYFEASVPARKRKELRRQHKRLSESGTLRFHRYCDDYRIDQWCADFLQLEHSGWKGREGSSLSSAPATAAMFRTSLHGGAARGRVERISLSLDAKPIAMQVNFLAAPGSFSYKTAFDEAYARFSPGVLLQRENLALLGRKEISWSDSCAAAGHPMIDRIWRERRGIIRVNVGIGGALRKSLCQQILRAETTRMAQRA